MECESAVRGGREEDAENVGGERTWECTALPMGTCEGASLPPPTRYFKGTNLSLHPVGIRWLGFIWGLRLGHVGACMHACGCGIDEKAHGSKKPCMLSATVHVCGTYKGEAT